MEQAAATSAGLPSTLCPSLASLQLMPGTAVMALYLPPLHSLRSLSLDGSDLAQPHVAAVAQLTQLHTLMLAGLYLYLGHQLQLQNQYSGAQ
jgi:hypothetical protein